MNLMSCALADENHHLVWPEWVAGSVDVRSGQNLMKQYLGYLASVILGAIDFCKPLLLFVVEQV